MTRIGQEREIIDDKMTDDKMTERHEKTFTLAPECTFYSIPVNRIDKE